MIHETRIRDLNNRPESDGEYVLYWMQASQRAECNHALEYAIRAANDRKLPVLAVFGLMAGYPEANVRHYAFMLEGFRETRETLAARNVQLVIRLGNPPEVALEFADRAALVICDQGYTRHQKAWRVRVAAGAPCRVVRVEADVVVPVEEVSDKQEFAARTIRPKITRLLDEYLVPLRESRARKSSMDLDIESLDLSDSSHLFRVMDLDCSVPPSPFFTGGNREAERRLMHFIRENLNHYADKRSDPGRDYASHLSPYLHFGQISPLRVALEVRKSRGKDRKNEDSFLEELIVRRELSINFIYYRPSTYDSYDGLPEWARKTLREHVRNKREKIYSEAELEAARTEDPYWNAAMKEMIFTGYMHNYMRMYWGKKILLWTKTPEIAYRIALRLNNRFFLDGRDPNSYVGVGWVLGLHDRPWQEREVIGKIRSMTSSGLERKFDMEGYLRRIDDYG